MADLPEWKQDVAWLRRHTHTLRLEGDHAAAQAVEHDIRKLLSAPRGSSLSHRAEKTRRADSAQKRPATEA